MKQELTEDQVETLFMELSESLGISKDTILWVYSSIGVLSERLSTSKDKDTVFHVTARDVCRGLIQDLCNLYPEPPEKVLSGNGIQSSEDVGRIIYGLQEKGLIVESSTDSEADFAQIFTTSDIETFIKEENIKRPWFHLSTVYHRLMWIFYLFGGALVLGSHLHWVPYNIAWCGWFLAMLGFLMQFVKLPVGKRF